MFKQIVGINELNEGVAKLNKVNKLEKPDDVTSGSSQYDYFTQFMLVMSDIEDQNNFKIYFIIVMNFNL